MKKIITGWFIAGFCCMAAQNNKLVKEPVMNDTNAVLSLIDSVKVLRYTDYKKAEEFAMAAISHSQKTGYTRGEALSYSALASVYYNKGEMPVAEKTAHLALDKLVQCGTRSEISDATNRLGLICMVQAKYYQAENYFQQSLQISLSLKDSTGIVKATHNLGVISFYKSEFDKTAGYYNQSLRMAEKIGDQKRISINQLNLGLLYDAQKDFSKSKQYIRKALANYQKTKDMDGMASCWQGLGTTFFNDYQFDSSFIAHQNALAIFEKLGKQDGIAQQWCNLADIYIRRSQYKKAIDFYLASVKARKENDDKFGLVLSYTGLANANFRMGNPAVANLYYDSALVISQEVDSPWKTADLYNFISDFQAKTGNYKAAYEALQHYSEGKDTLLSAQKMNVVHELEALYENEKKQQDLKNKQNEIHYLKKNNRMFLWLLVLSGFIALLVALLLVNRVKQIRIRTQRAIELEKKDRELVQARNKEVELELDYKKKELTQLALHISTQNEFLESFKNSLKTVSDDKQLKTLERELESKIVLDKQREAFEMNIDLIHKDFFRKLMEKFPTLTENEKKLCAMLRLNLSSKEIASVQNISVKSVEMNRYRLRKKLPLNNDDDLTAFISAV